MYYVIEYYYTGNSDQCIDGDKIEISTTPAINPYGDGEWYIDDGFAIPDYLVTTHGEYATIKEARDAIYDIFGDVREVELAHPDADVIESYKPGKYTPITKNEAIDILHHEFSVDVKAEMTDDDIDKLVDDYEIALNHEHGLTMWHHSKSVYPTIYDFTEHLIKARDLLKLED